MGRSSKLIAGEVRLRSPSWKAWAVASIALCLAFAGAGDARAQAINISPAIATPKLPPINISPPIAIPKLPAINVSSAIATPKLPAIVTQFHVSAPGLIVAKAGTNSIPGGVLGPAGGAIQSLARPVNGGPAPLNNAKGTPAAGPADVLMLHYGNGSKSGGDTLGGAPVGGGPSAPRAYAPASYGSNTVCGRYPYPACH